MNLYISDLHFGHRNVIGFDHRPFGSVGEMDYTLIQLWNSRVRPDDDVYIVGDLCYRNERPAEWYLRQLTGRKHLIIGNHDEETLNNPRAMAYIESAEKMQQIDDNGEHICLCHFPIAEWNGYHKGSWLIYGHIHNRRDESYEFMKTQPKALNAGCMINNYTPCSLNELIRNNKAFQEKDNTLHS